MFQLSNVRPDSGSRLFGEQYFNSASDQEVFACEHLFRQREHSYQPETIMCAYRGANGKMCAAGPFLDKVSFQHNTGSSWSIIHGWKELTAHTHLIARLQDVHDQNNLEYWYLSLEELAHEYGLYWNFSDWTPI